MTDAAAEIKSYFIRRKRESPESTKRSYTIGDQFTEIFEKAATLCKNCNATPVDYVDAHFHNTHADEVYPQFLAGSNSVKKYNEYEINFKASYASIFEHFKAKLKRQIELGRKVEWILNCKDLDFPAWFRICITQHPVKEVIDNYKPAAKQEYCEKLRDFLISKKLDYRRIINEV